MNLDLSDFIRILPVSDLSDFRSFLNFSENKRAEAAGWRHFDVGELKNVYLVVFLDIILLRPVFLARYNKSSAS